MLCLSQVAHQSLKLNKSTVTLLFYNAFRSVCLYLYRIFLFKVSGIDRSDEESSQSLLCIQSSIAAFRSFSRSSGCSCLGMYPLFWESVNTRINLKLSLWFLNLSTTPFLWLFFFLFILNTLEIATTRADWIAFRFGPTNDDEEEETVGSWWELSREVLEESRPSANRSIFWISSISDKSTVVWEQFGIEAAERGQTHTTHKTHRVRKIAWWRWCCFSFVNGRLCQWVVYTERICWWALVLGGLHPLDGSHPFVIGQQVGWATAQNMDSIYSNPSESCCDAGIYL